MQGVIDFVRNWILQLWAYFMQSSMSGVYVALLMIFIGISGMLAIMAIIALTGERNWE